MILKYIVAGIILIVNVKTYSQEPDPASFFPSSVGNLWGYDSNHGFIDQKIYSDSIGQDESRFLFFAPNSNPIFKIDTAFNVYYLPFDLNWLNYKLDADYKETWLVQPEKPTPPGAQQRVEARVDSIYQAFVFGAIRYVKQINYYRLPFGDTTITENTFWDSYILLISGVGEYYEFNAEEGPTRILQGCIIDGDTLGTITSVNDKTLVTSGFNLYQNYPNPFNPNTTIEYNLKIGSNVTLIIYNLLGEEMTKLVEEYQPAGYHKVNFNARELPSGVYIYVIKAGEYFSSKKMMLTK